jgi:hypothetical protein
MGRAIAMDVGAGRRETERREVPLGRILLMGAPWVFNATLNGDGAGRTNAKAPGEDDST